MKSVPTWIGNSVRTYCIFGWDVAVGFSRRCQARTCAGKWSQKKSNFDWKKTISLIVKEWKINVFVAYQNHFSTQLQIAMFWWLQCVTDFLSFTALLTQADKLFSLCLGIELCPMGNPKKVRYISKLDATTSSKFCTVYRMTYGPRNCS